MPRARSDGERGCRVAVDPQLDDLAAERPQQRGGRVERDDPARVDDRDPVAEPLGLVEVVRREQDRHPVAVAQAGDHVEQLVADARVEPDGRLVEEEHLRPETSARAISSRRRSPPL